jgi:hypothetical protein
MRDRMRSSQPYRLAHVRLMNGYRAQQNAEKQNV